MFISCTSGKRIVGVVPHPLLEWSSALQGFRAHLRHYCNTSSSFIWFVRAAGWPERANELHVDELLLDKVLSCHHERACMECAITIKNLSSETKYVTLWIHSSFAPWSSQCCIVADGQRQEYSDTDIYWGIHVVPPQGVANVVLAALDNTLFAVFGTAANHACGVAEYSAGRP